MEPVDWLIIRALMGVREAQGYKAQSEMVMESLDRLISSCAARHESLVCEGVHLSLNFVVQLMRRHPTIVPFLIYISNEDKHKERFAVSASGHQLSFLFLLLSFFFNFLSCHYFSVQIIPSQWCCATVRFNQARLAKASLAQLQQI